ncbi:NADPH-dependent 7-cyano-7-deazaguanine reductase QueF [Marinilabilia salmonicolor]|uniref:NADPH-dependent 7-cyano-7-deazaguanine reductase QueF n=1 Tax=Marinilabilia salmonicolor TaxID=989 RepID=UPI00029A7865|nr:NADPH-dependent 7-cyano-7-deazaguanine reductase QueF [Marinilabilia salmonicolor]
MNNEAKYLGKATKYPKQYAPEVLVPVPRVLNRKIYGLEEHSLPFTGMDVWHAYELSFLTQKGMPVAGLLKIIYPSDSPNIVESKSLKLYLNSFNMERFGNRSAEGTEMVLQTIKDDLEKLLETKVEVSFFSKEESSKADFTDYEILEEQPEVENTEFSIFHEDPELLKEDRNNQEKEINVSTHLLRSNCKVTFQPDWGSAFIHLKGRNIPDRPALLQYIVSIRNENHFHEEICEMIYKRLWDKFSPEELMVSCIYTRRGGIDICPVRTSAPELMPENLVNKNKLMSKLLRQ